MIEETSSSGRVGRCQRETRETRVEARWALDGRGSAEVSTGVGFLDHMLELLAQHGLFDLEVRAQGDLHVDEHHTVEDVGIVLGRALNEALGERRSLRRIAHAIVPMDEALALVAVDLSGRGLALVDVPLSGPRIGAFPTDMVEHFLHSLAVEARITLHVQLLRGRNDHHIVEAVFKGLARALDAATERDPRLGDAVPSSKGLL